eukprot:scaffold5718_cov112-Skeletonema_dohrnii-CCMP3373.AAC.9
MKYLHSQGIIFRDLKPQNVGFDRQNTLKLLDFGLARFMPRDKSAYEDLHHLGGSGTLRYSAPEVIFRQPYNLKADVYSFSVLLWEVMCLKKPFAKYKQKEDFRKAFLKVDFEHLAINRRWPEPLQHTLERGLSRDLWARPTLSEVCTVLNDCALFVDVGENVSTRALSLSRSKKLLVDLSRLPSKSTSKRGLQKSRSSSSLFDQFLLQEGDMWDQSLQSPDAGTFESYSRQEKEKKELWKLKRETKKQY